NHGESGANSEQGRQLGWPSLHHRPHILHRRRLACPHGRPRPCTSSGEDQEVNQFRSVILSLPRRGLTSKPRVADLGNPGMKIGAISTLKGLHNESWRILSNPYKVRRLVNSLPRAASACPGLR